MGKSLFVSNPFEQLQPERRSHRQRSIFKEELLRFHCRPAGCPIHSQHRRLAYPIFGYSSSHAIVAACPNAILSPNRPVFKPC